MRRVLLSLAVVVSIVVAAPPASATYPGANGEVLYSSFDLKFRNPSLWTILPDGTQRTRLDANRAAYGAWSPDGSTIAYTRDSHDGESIHLLDASTDERTRILAETDLPNRVQFLWNVTWDPTGARLAFCASSGRFEIFVVDADGSNLTQISRDRDLCFPDWSATDRIVADAGFNDRTRIITMDPDGSNTEELVALAPDRHTRFGVSADPSWAPDGSAVAFTSAAARRQSDIWLVNADGTSARRLTTTPRWEYSPVFSPDGTSVAYARGGRRPFQQADLWLDRLDGGRTRLVRGPGFQAPTSWRAV